MRKGGGFLHANPGEKHCVQQSMLGQQKQGTCAGDTLSTAKHKSPLDVIQNFQKKSQFRTIAPKMGPKILTSGVVSSLQSSLPEPSTPISAASSKPLVVPTQNYTVMQVAGQEGTFSLLAVPYVAPALTQQAQQSNVVPSENPKLPIPRYQSVRNKLLSGKKQAKICGLDAHNKIPTKALVSSQTSPMTTLTEGRPETPSSSDSTEQAMLTDCDSSEIAVATQVNESSCMESGSSVMNKTEIANSNISGLSVVRESLSKPASNPMKLRLCSVKTTSENKRSVMTSEKLKEKPTDSANPVAVLSQAVFGSTVQMTPLVPKGKLPILPYSRMKNSAFCSSKKNINVMDVSGPSLRSECEKLSALAKNKAFDEQLAVPFTQVPKQTIQENTFSPSSKVDINSLKNLDSPPSKKRGRRRRAPDDLLAFQTKRRKCIINKLREGRERAKVDIQTPDNKKGEAVKKYRSIRPKPVVVVQAFAPLTSTAIVETPSRDHLEQGVLLNGSLASKYLSYKHSDATSGKSSDLSRNACSAIPKLLHRCAVCNCTFQYKHHLQDHMSSHTNKRPYSCRICWKACFNLGSLSTHIKFHHNEGKPKKLVCCEFCAKVFGHAKVYFGHLREVHRVVVSTEPSPSEQQIQDALKKRDTNMQEEEKATERRNKCNFEDLFHNPVGVKLQVRCGRCEFIAQSFGEMKFHLLCSHGEEIQGRVGEGVVQGNRGAKEELIKHTNHFWKPCNERRHVAKYSAHEEEIYTFPKLKRQIHSHHQNNLDILSKGELPQSRSDETTKEMQNVGFGTPSEKIEFWSKAGYNCILCKKVFGRKEDLCNHWQSHHNCEDPSALWTIFSLVSKQGIIEFSNNGKS
ncbi:zinc finger protein 438 isoform X2 [Pithys albifrons albifrons]|uniref:zinc finger protein 438 isoform X2 n=1 Tax=Pithys albifrons albifrons TaxID=3385563 RepID=UPI003A5CDF65